MQSILPKYFYRVSEIGRSRLNILYMVSMYGSMSYTDVRRNTLENRFSKIYLPLYQNVIPPRSLTTCRWELYNGNLLHGGNRNKPQEHL